MIWLVVAFCWGLAGFLALATLYRAVLAIAALLNLRFKSSIPELSSAPKRFVILIPAHNEELLIQEVIRSIRAPTSQFGRTTLKVLVVL